MANLHAVVGLLDAPDGGGPRCASLRVASGIHRVYRLLWLLRGVMVLALLICLSHLRKRLFFFVLVSRTVGMKDGLGLVVLR